MTKTEQAKQLRADPARHYNCAQSVLVPYAAELGLDGEGAFRLGAHFGSGMRHGSTCGALSAGLMVLGALGYDEGEALTLLKDFRAAHGATDCAALLRRANEEGVPRKTHCDGLVEEVVTALEALRAKG